MSPSTTVTKNGPSTPPETGFLAMTNDDDDSGSVRSSASAVSTLTSASVTKILSTLVAVPTNRRCAECKIALVDPSQVHVSYCLPAETADRAPQQAVGIYDFRRNHKAFAPPVPSTTTASSSDGTVGALRSQTDSVRSTLKAKHPVVADPSLHVNEKIGGHCVFVCQQCSLAHQTLGSAITTVRAFQDVSAPWTPELATYLSECGGNARSWKVYERHITEGWEHKRPTPSSSLPSRVLFCRAKYEALTFALPPMGPLGPKLWKRILLRDTRLHPSIARSLALPDRIESAISFRNSMNTVANPQTQALPDRLVDFFCVVKSSMKLDRRHFHRHHKTINSIYDLMFLPHIDDCYPDKTAHPDTEFPEHLATFALPKGCNASSQQLPPAFYSIVLTNGDGRRIHGYVLQIYDEPTDVVALQKSIIDTENDDDEILDFLENKCHSDTVVFFPKCLVVLSHHPYHSFFRDVLLRLYKITLVEAPLPIERYIANFVREVPLPPRGRVRVEFGFSADKVFRLERPPPNCLPKADVSFRPLFAALSVGNIITLVGCLLEECQVALVSSHVSMLCPVAQALLALLFPFQWQALYVPVLPDSMYDILDAPVPFLVGLNSRYLQETDPKYRPKGVILVDLDRDVVHLGYREERNGMFARRPPPLPHQDAMKLKHALDEHGGSVYIIPDSGLKGCIMTGDSTLLLNNKREQYAHMTSIEVTAESLGRKEIFRATDKAYSAQQLAAKIDMSVHGQFTDDAASKQQDSNKTKNKKGRTPQKAGFMAVRAPFGRGAKRTSSDYARAREQGHLLDSSEPKGFSSAAIREAFLRFFVTIFSGYKQFLLKNSGNDLFREAGFLEDQSVSKQTLVYLNRVLETQLFQCFLEECTHNPMQPEVRFFDESILEKNNRSRVFILRNGGKKLETPFLDDESMKISQTYIAPKPSNVGLPVQKASYHYGVFPKLNPKLFGNPRPAMTWTQYEQKSLRNVRAPSARVLQTEQAMMGKAGKQSSQTQTAFYGMAKRLAQDFDSALTSFSPMNLGNPMAPVNMSSPLVSKHPTPAYEKMSKKNGKRQGSKKKKSKKHMTSSDSDRMLWDDGVRPPSLRTQVSMPTKTETVLLDTRRKQAILLSLVTKIQRSARIYIARKHRKELIQARNHCQPGKRQDKSKTDESLQEIFHLRRRIKAIVLIQRHIRAFTARVRSKKRRAAASVIQHHVRGALSKWHYRKMRYCATIVQARARGHRAHFLFRTLQALVSKIQAQFRGHQLRKRLDVVVNNRLDVYRKQIFVLWQSAGTSLVFRTRMWPNLFCTYPFLCMGMAETELLRLWKRLRINPMPKSSPLFDNTINGFDGDAIVLRHDVYQRCLELRSGIDSITSADVAQAAFPKKQNLLADEQAERVQIYERLSAKGAESTSQSIIRRFDIDSKSKLKKDAVARGIWNHMKHANVSAETMIELFPEIENQNAIAFRKPSTKAAKRFPKATKWTEYRTPVSLQTLQQNLLEGRVKEDLGKIALSMLSYSPRHIMRGEAKHSVSKQEIRRQRHVYMAVHGFDEWVDCRRVLLRQFIAPASTIAEC